MNKYFVILCLLCLIVISCEDNELKNADCAIGITAIQGNLDSLAFVDFKNQKINCIDAVKNIPNLSDIKYSCRSYNENYYIYAIQKDRYTVNLYNLETKENESVLINDTSIILIEGMEVDELENILYLITLNGYSFETLKIGLYPIMIKSKEILPKIEITIRNNNWESPQTEIDYKNKRIFISHYNNDSILICNYRNATIQKKYISNNFSEINYNYKTNSLNGIAAQLSINNYSITDDSLKINKLDEHLKVIAYNYNFFDKNENCYWISSFTNYKNLKNMYKINQATGAIIDSVTLKYNIKYIH